MAWTKGQGKGETERFNIRLGAETAAFYRIKSKEHGVSISEFLRHTLVQGVIAENVAEIEARLKAAVGEMHAAMVGGVGGGLPANALLSLYTMEEMLKAIVEARDPQELYRAQDKAKKRIESEGRK